MSKDKKPKVRAKKLPNRRLQLTELLAEAKLKGHTITSEALSDKSGSYVELYIDDMTLCFWFDYEGTKLDKISLYKDVVQVVSTEQVWTTKSEA